MLEALLLMLVCSIDCGTIFATAVAPAEIVLLYVWLSKWLLLSLRAPSLSAWLSSLAHSTGDGARQRCTFAAQDEHLALVAPLLQTS